MRLRGKRWIYRFGNHEVRAENAWHWSGWAQERLVVDGEVVRAAGGHWRTSERFEVRVPDSADGAKIKVALDAGLFSIHCRASRDDVLMAADDVQYGQWDGEPGVWPD